MKQRVIAGIICLLMMGLAAACGTASAEEAQTTGAEETEEIIGMPNPFEEVDTLKEAAEKAGFEISVPDAPSEYPDRIIRVIEGEMIEVVYADNAKTTEDAVYEGFRIRKAAGTDDVSGDYNDYADEKTVTVGEYSVTLRGDGETWAVAVWTSNGYSYAVDAQDNPLTEEAMTELIDAVK